MNWKLYGAGVALTIVSYVVLAAVPCIQSTAPVWVPFVLVGFWVGGALWGASL